MHVGLHSIGPVMQCSSAVCADPSDGSSVDRQRVHPVGIEVVIVPVGFLE